ncbi:hypothetical protein [Solibaculum mannosilyticum]|uniref:hypothetical protein n=1 Tax=Solibaculum mannosilyticum TaxID=2780922 RepID=UPI0034BD654C
MKNKLFWRLSLGCILLFFLSGLILCHLFSNIKEITKAPASTADLAVSTPEEIQIVCREEVILNHRCENGKANRAIISIGGEKFAGD